MVHFALTHADARLVERIVERAIGTKAVWDVLSGTRQDLMMDIEAVHCNGCPLRLEELLKADAFNFAHDVLGIRRHINRDTGKLGSHFLPRFAEQQ